ncbi:MAG: hypothetical protein FWE80_09805, partial [Oscillospiraceae bacterium]|nr:hypothetical protein [Oscillospiraceae bacterium]
GQTVECQVPQPNPDKEIIVYCRSDDPAVLTAEDDGAITGVSPGSTTVQLKTSGGKSAQYVFHTVERQPMNKWLAILVRGGLVLVIPTGLSLLLFWKTEENKAVLALMKQVLKKFIIRNA